MAARGVRGEAGRLQRRLGSFSHRSTGFKLFLILSLALLPLGMIAFFATLQSNRTADLERQAQIRIALAESSRKLAATFASDVSAIRVALQAVEDLSEDPTICARLSTILSAQDGATIPFAIFGPGSLPLCASAGFQPARPSTISLNSNGSARYELREGHLAIIVPGGSPSYVGIIRDSARTLAKAGTPGDYVSAYSLSLTSENESLPLIDQEYSAGLAGYQTLSAPIGNTGLSVEMTIMRDPFSTAEIIAILLPLLMWAAAAAIGWLVVDRVLIRPLRRLEREVSAYQPGEILEPTNEAESAEELRQLGATFHKITRMISTHEAALAEGLARQTRLTREVHHRVKNNLQVIASLINLHARGVKSPDVARAYASIQRRVDALAVVHRNHFAELEESRGVELRKLIGELAQNLRGSVPEGEPAPIISLSLSACYATQDIAVPIAFLLTELIELAMVSDPTQPIAIALRIEEAGKARISVCSPALTQSAEMEERLRDRFGRVLEGLSRQLRSPLEHQQKKGEFSLLIPIVPLPAHY